MKKKINKNTKQQQTIACADTMMVMELVNRYGVDMGIEMFMRGVPNNKKDNRR